LLSVEAVHVAACIGAGTIWQHQIYREDDVLRYDTSTTSNGDTNDDRLPVVKRLEDAAAGASGDGRSYYAYPVIEGMLLPDDLVVVTIMPDAQLGWRLTMLEGRYEGEMRVTRTGHPDARARRHMANMVFHETDGVPAEDRLPAIDLVRALEEYDDDVVLHPRAARTVVEARRAEDARIPIVRPSPFTGLLRSAGIVGGLLALANTIAVLGLFATWGNTPLEVRQYVLSTTTVTLGMLVMSPLLLSRLSRESQLFSRPGAQRQGRIATIRVGQMVIMLAILSAINGIMVLS